MGGPRGAGTAGGGGAGGTPSRRRILVVIGTRPEVIKLAPVVRRLLAEPGRFETVTCVTAQHRDMLDSLLELFEVRADVDLDLMRPGQTLNGIARGVLDRFDATLDEVAPDWVVVQGDTTTAMAASLAAFHRRIRVAHVEAGLRTGDLENPFPEEMNRRVIDLFAAAQFAPTPRSAEALRREGVPEARIHVTGNTVVDALQWIVVGREPPRDDGRLVLVTTHRRESFGEPMRRVLSAVRRLAERFGELTFVFPVHPNPAVQEAVEVLRGTANVELVPPADYRQLVEWMRASRIVLTDSGGIQEEAPTFGKPTLVLRKTTERPEGIDAGVAKLVGTDEERIYDEACRLLTDREAYRRMARAINPYGDGRAAERIAKILGGGRAEPFRPERDADP